MLRTNIAFITFAIATAGFACGDRHGTGDPVGGSGGASGPGAGGGGGAPADGVGVGGNGGDRGVGGDSGNGGNGNGGSAGTGGMIAGGPPPCPDLFAQTLQTFSIDISPDDLARMQAEFIAADQLPDADFVNYQAVNYPVTLHFGEETAPPAFIHLKGDSSWREAVEVDGQNGKMQFVVAFDQIDANAQFHGIGKLGFDMPRTDLSFLHDRVANTWLRSVGIPAICATSARLMVNGSYYGLFVLEERIGHHFAKEFFPTNPDGDLMKGGWVPETNKLAPNWSRVDTFWKATDAASLSAIVDVAGSLPSWAAEALLNDGDGYWGGDHNFLIYDQGAKGYVFLPDDLDSTLDYLGSFNGDPVAWWSARNGVQLIGQHYLVVMHDPALRAQYIDALRAELARWDVATLQSWIDAWSAQIRDAVATDPHKPADTTVQVFDAAVALARRGIADRADFVRRWLDCQQTGTGEDKDGDGFIWCQDCRDDDALVNPAAPEICGNAIDDNCDGVYDQMCTP